MAPSEIQRGAGVFQTQTRERPRAGKSQGYSRDLPDTPAVYEGGTQIDIHLYIIKNVMITQLLRSELSEISCVLQIYNLFSKIIIYFKHI